MPKWTEEQRKAIELTEGNVLLSAAAGSGKTTVLVERVLRLIVERRADIDHILVVTFTRAAASDMRAKLSVRLGEYAEAGDERCREQLLKLDQASISTLHAFCADFLRLNFETAGVDPSFRIIDDAVDQRLRGQALDEAMEETYGGETDALISLDYGRGTRGVRAAAEILMKRMEDHPDPGVWLSDVSCLEEDTLLQWQDELKSEARRDIQIALIQLYHALGLPGCPANYDYAIRMDIPELERLLTLEDYDELYRALKGWKAVPATKMKRGSGSEPDAAEAVKRLREAAKRAIAGIRMQNLPLIQARKDAMALSGQIKFLAGIAMKASEKYMEAKAEQALLTYSDLEHFTLRALQDEELARATRQRFAYVFVDEYQDTSDVQEAVINAVCRGDNLFTVGDVKQSIYRFRLAEPRLFLEKYRAYGMGCGGSLLPLTRNFRSKRGILDFVNLVFQRLMTGGDSEIMYDALARLNPGLEEDPPKAPDVRTQIILVEKAAGDKEETTSSTDALVDDLKDVEREGIVIARAIQRMMREDPSLHYRDFAILSRVKAGVSSAIMPIMLAHGIPAFADGQSGYYDSLEVQWLLAVLRLLTNARRDMDLIALLHSPAAGLSADELAEIRMARKRLAFVDAVAAYAEETDNETAEKLRMILGQLDSWRLKQSCTGLGELIRLILDESGFYTYVGALPGGSQRQANLDQFVNSADNYDSTYNGSLVRFLKYTDYIRQSGDGEVAQLLGENDDVVRMMSVHKSKGLEFRVVFGMQLGKHYKDEKSNAPLVAHHTLGIGMSYFDPVLRTRRLTLPQAAIMARRYREDRAEEMRILYVMLTRAKDHLVLVGTVKDIERSMRNWNALAAAPFASGSHLDLIMAARCWAEKAGEDLHSELTVISAESIRIKENETTEVCNAPMRNILSGIQANTDVGMYNRLAWSYPDPISVGKPMKLTASGLLRELEGPEEIPVLMDRPSFLAFDASHMTGAERGSAYHRCLQLLAFESLKGLSSNDLEREVANQLDRYTDRRLLQANQREAVRIDQITKFLQSDVGLRLRRAQVVKREWPFNVKMRISEALTPQEAGRFGSEELLVQGIIDCCFMEGGQWVLLDYKTDRTSDLNALREHYRRQLAVYAHALFLITGISVKERLLCLLESGQTLAV